MFDSTHDAILLILALLYVLIGMVRAITASSAPRSRYVSSTQFAAWLSMPFWIAAILASVAVIW
jgi:hypothetical protein